MYKLTESLKEQYEVFINIVISDFTDYKTEAQSLSTICLRCHG